MSLLSIPLDAARAGTRVVGAAASVATLPARAATRLGFSVVEAMLDLREHALVEEAGVSSVTPRLRDEPPGVARRRNGDGNAIPAVRPSIARNPGAKRRASTPGIPGDADLSVPALPVDFGAPPVAEPRLDRPPAPISEPPRRAPEPGHVEPQATLVAESADAGAEEGAGASVRVEAPWPRYGRMTAAEIVDRLPAQEQAVLSLVLLYERSHRGRRTVIAAAERALKRRASPARR